METIAKDYYKNYEASNEILRVHNFLAAQIINFNPTSVFEFGCGSGKNLKLLQTLSDRITRIQGIDISLKNIENTRNINNLIDCFVGDENTLACMKEDMYDVVFTCSVLDHIEEIAGIIKNFEKIAKKGIVLLETNDKSLRYPNYYYPHKYEDYGFRKMNYEYISNEVPDADGCKYEIWIKNLVSQS